MRATVAGLPPEAFARPSGCTGWLVRDLVCHLVIDAQDVLITLATPTEQEPTRDTASYWEIAEAPRPATTRSTPAGRVCTRDQVLTVADYLTLYVLEWTLHHLDLIAHLPDVTGPPDDGLARSRQLLEQIAGATFPPSFTDPDALLVGTGRRAPTDPERAGLPAAYPLVLG